MTDTSLLQPQYWQLVAEFFPPRLGGEPEAWTQANKVVAPEVWRRLLARLEAWDASTGNVRRDWDLYYADWLDSMCHEVGVEGPTRAEASTRLALEAEAWIRSRARAIFSDVLPALTRLTGTFTLFTASDGMS